MDFYTNLVGSNIGYQSKFFLVMRLIIILITTGITQTNASSYEKTLSLIKNNNSIKEIFKEIKYQTGYKVRFQKEVINTQKIISRKFLNTTLQNVLKICLDDTDLQYFIAGEVITITLKKKSLLTKNSVLLDSTTYKGRVLKVDGSAMGGATVRVVGSTRTTISNSHGDFTIYGPLKGSLQVSYVGYSTSQITLNGLDPANIIQVFLSPGFNNLEEVNVVSTGYQEISKERATGSFEVITKEQLQHSVDPNLIRRLEGITASTNFNNNRIPTSSAADPLFVGLQGRYAKSPIANLTVRGKNTLNQAITATNTSGSVLVVIDGVASPYSIDKVDPNDVESITILKDAAAASIWGARAANGVIVVTTKRGAFNKPVSVTFNSNYSLTEKPKLSYIKNMTTSEYIDAEIFKFNASGMTIDPPNTFAAQPLYSPVYEILNKEKAGIITSVEANSQINSLRNNDINQDFDKYILRNSISQNYSLAMDGGNAKQSYRLSVAYNNSRNNTINSSAERLSINYTTTVKLLKNWQLIVGAFYNEQNDKDQDQNNAVRPIVNSPYLPYTRLVDIDGQPINIPFRYRSDFIDLISATYGSNIQDLHYNPLLDINQGYLRTDSKNLNLNFATNYRINSFINANLLYNISVGNNTQKALSRENSFYMRDLVTRYTMSESYSDPVLGAQPFFQQIPSGGYLNQLITKNKNQTLRGQINFDKKWNDQHEVSGIIGVDLAENYNLNSTNDYYGYNETSLETAPRLNYYGLFQPLFIIPNGGDFVDIPYTSSFRDYKVRTFSIFSNAAYTFKGRYSLSASIRKDLSSEFGKGTNKGGTPFFSVGAKWNISNEPFYNVVWLPKLQLRTTFGYNGNVNPMVSAQPLIIYSSGVGINGLKSATTGNDATNNDLRPEKTAVLNFGLDYGLKNNKLSGSIEFYQKNTTDLLSVNLTDPSTGFNHLTFNTASLRGWGSDLSLNSENIRLKDFSWSTNFIFSHNRVKVKKLYTPEAKTSGDLILGSITYNEGADLSRIYAFRWAGLDPATGDPRVMIDNIPVAIPSEFRSGLAAYNTIYSSKISDAHYFGSSVPVCFGSLRNTFNYGALSVSANIIYKLGYFFRRPASTVVQYDSFLSRSNVLPAEYSTRWQKPGDEATTNVPSMTYPGSFNRDLIYYYSDINVQKADHIRLQEINVSYAFTRKKWLLKNARLYFNVSNLGILWRANRLGLDPDIYDYPMPRTYSLGFSANL